MSARLNHQGYIVQIDEPERVIQIREALAAKHYFTENVSVRDVKPGSVGLYLIGYDRGQIDMAALGVPTGTPSTGSARIKLKRVVELGSVKIRDLIIKTELANTIHRRIVKENNVNIKSGIFNEMLDRLIKKNPSKKREIEELIRLANGIDFHEQPKKAEIFAMQQDSLSAAFKASRIRIPGAEDFWEPDEFNDGSTYLDGFIDFAAGQHATEDEILQHDTQYFGGFSSSGTRHIATRVFSDGKTRLFVTMANRTKLERVLGVDLIYFSERHNSISLVQYKRMTKRGTTFVYYPRSDRNYRKDMSLMKQHTETIKKIERAKIGNPLNAHASNYRIFNSPFFFKFVNSVQFSPMKNTVIHGYYVSFDLWKAVESEHKENEQTLVATASTLERHLGANEFCALLNRGLIGSRHASSRDIKKVIADCLKQERSVVFARETKLIEEEPEDEDWSED